MSEDYDYEGLPHPEVRQLVSRLMHSPTGSAELDDAVLRTLPYIAGRDAEFQPTRIIDDAIFLIPSTWWWHVSHLEAQVIPTTPAPGAEMVLSNAGRHDEKGRPIRYSAMAHYDRAHLPCAVCAALLMAVYDLPAAFMVQAKATEREDEEIIAARMERARVWRGMEV